MDYSEQELDRIFYSARSAGFPGYAYDCDGRIICRWAYGQYTEFGWQVDHNPPQAFAGLLGMMPGLRPRHWQGNTSAGGAIGNLLKQLADNPYAGIGGAFSSDKKR